LLRADHEHSRLVETRRVPDPPDGGNAELSALTCTPHLVAEGPVTVSVCEDEPQDVERTAAAAIATTVCSLTDEPERATLCTGPRFGDRS
jgi:hypothetical protein